MHLNELDFNQLDDALTSARFNEHTPKQIDDALAVLRGLRGSVITDQDMDLAREEWGTTDDIQIEQNGTASHEALAAIERLEADNALLQSQLDAVKRHIPINYLQSHDVPGATGPTAGLNLEAAMREYAEDRWKLLDRFVALRETSHD